MFSSNPFYDLNGFISPMVMQIYVIVMFLLVVGGTLLDIIHKKSAQYFFENAQKAKASAKRAVGGGEKTSLAVQTLANEVLSSSEFKNPKRRMSHLLLMYGFILFVVSTVVMIFGYATDASAGVWPFLWHLGAAMTCIGGYWFWFFIRVDVFSEAKPWYQLVRADLFIVSLLMMTTFALLWSIIGGTFLFALFIVASTTLFSTVLWSKFAHMFFKPAAAYQKKIIMADGSNENLPDDYDLTDPEVQAKFPDIPEYMGENPPYMGLGIKREPANHY